MKKIAILIDSAGNLKEDIDRGIFVVPLYVNFKNESFKDLEDITPEELYRRIDEEDMPQTSAPSIADFADKIAQIKSLGYEQILGINMSSKLSGTFNAMRLALESSDIEYFALDSKQVSIGEGMLALYGAELIEQGKSLEEVYNTLSNKRKDVRLYGVFNSLKYVMRGGRISHLTGIVGGLLKLNPIFSFDSEGSPAVTKVIRGRTRALKEVLQLVHNEIKPGENYYFGLAYAKSEKQIEPLKEGFTEIIEGAKELIEHPITAVLGTHGGPDTYVVCYLKI